jgi:hypothetical protein
VRGVASVGGVVNVSCQLSVGEEQLPVSVRQGEASDTLCFYFFQKAALKEPSSIRGFPTDTDNSSDTDNSLRLFDRRNRC